MMIQTVCIGTIKNLFQRVTNKEIFGRENEQFNEHEQISMMHLRTFSALFHSQ